MILPDVGASFDRDDAAPLTHLLARRGEDRTSPEALVSERGIHALFDHPQALDALVSEPGLSAAPLALFSYVALRHGLLESGVEPGLLADYVSESRWLQG